MDERAGKDVLPHSMTRLRRLSDGGMDEESGMDGESEVWL